MAYARKHQYSYRIVGTVVITWTNVLVFKPVLYTMVGRRFLCRVCSSSSSGSRVVKEKNFGLFSKEKITLVLNLLFSSTLFADKSLFWYQPFPSQVL